MPTHPHRIGVLAYPGCFASEVFGVIDVLTMANRVAAEMRVRRGAPFLTSVVSPRRRVVASGGTTIGVEPPGPLDLLLVPGFELVRQDLDGRIAALDREVEVIRAAAGRRTPVTSICVGAFLLGAAGLLDGRRATTSWLFARELAARHPDAHVVPEELVVHDGRVTTTAAFSAMYDFALDLVRLRCGDDVARTTARLTLVDDARTSQTPYVDEQVLARRTRTFADEVRQWLDGHVAEPYDLGALAARFHVSTRTMLRRFRAETGESPLSYLQRVRVQRAKELLEDGDLPLAAVVNAVGYLDQGTFRRLFVQHTGVSPGDYRRQFRRPTTHRTGWSATRQGRGDNDCSACSRA